ncbi:hypothetical protein AC629_04545 [Bradyrhizobium sp. NAS80.1]|nr:hypothetical protein AC629_04545 [Bradyrhizobium sp. NAS80.1]
MERRLGQETRLSAPMHLRRMHEEWMAEIDIARTPRRQCFQALQFRTEFTQLVMRQPIVAGRMEQSCDIPMGSNLDTRWCVVLSNVREEKQHQERAPVRREVGAPIREVFSLLPTTRWPRKAYIDVPSCIPRIIGMRKAHRKSPETPAWPPAPCSDKLVKSYVENRAVDCPFERLVMIFAEPDNRMRP